MADFDITCPTCAKPLAADEELWADEYCQECWEEYCGHQFWEAMAGRQSDPLPMGADVD